MNTKIEELIAKATTSEKGPPNWDMTANTVITTFNKEKFAELIITECVTACITGKRMKPDAYGERVAASIDIAEHFGVAQ